MQMKLDSERVSRVIALLPSALRGHYVVLFFHLNIYLFYYYYFQRISFLFKQNKKFSSHFWRLQSSNGAVCPCKMIKDDFLKKDAIQLHWIKNRPCNSLHFDFIACQTRRGGVVTQEDATFFTCWTGFKKEIVIIDIWRVCVTPKTL